MTSSTTWQFVAVDAPNQLSQAGDEMDRILSARGASERTRLAARLVAEEIVLNAFEHGGAKLVTMELDESDPLRLHFADDGVPFDPAARPASDTDPEPAAPRGRGLLLVRGFTQRIEHHRIDGRNRLSATLVE